MQYSLIRDTVEIFRTESEMQYIDDNVIQPYETYTYILQVCTIEGCTSSEPVSFNKFVGLNSAHFQHFYFMLFIVCFLSKLAVNVPFCRSQ